MKKKNRILRYGASVAALSVAGVGAAHADAEAAITAAIAKGEALMNLVAPGVIAIAAIMLGVGLAVSWIRK
ncbi:hypothetical protein [Candidatus Methylobacter oryzae]|uniref:Methyltransferase n=1 Tax=Candidatus Methylobacter oryzae TaxID=2497749 RepID=A0ABY3CCL1_9GAMM|nr:hypothetical protein [Candidatus Methylobacter oryzae]TRW99833.1 hypothetical protein EKO24_006535 [Candidatus Methylobacter oryzae]